jgi:tetratricopeptide (TPR) repeat protein
MFITRRCLVVVSLALSVWFGLFQLPGFSADLRDNATRHADLAEELFEREQYADAIAEYQIAIRLSPHAGLSASLFNNLGLSFQRVRQYPQAIASFQHAIRIQPSFELYYVNLIKAYQEAGVMAVAKEKLFATVDRNPVDAEAWYLLGLLYEEIAEYEAAKAAFQAFLRLDPNSRLAQAARRHL